MILPPAPLTSKRVYERVADELRRQIERGDLRPGDRLPAERDLAARFGVSRPSVRAALIVLEGDDLIDVRAGDATYVTPRRLGDICIPPDALDALSCGALEQLEASTLVEVELAGGAAMRGERANLPQLTALLDAPREGDAHDRFPAPLARAFHSALANAAGNSLLASLAIGLWQIRKGHAWEAHRRVLFRFDDDPALLAERRRLLAALEARSKRDARTAMARVHLRMRDMLFG